MNSLAWRIESEDDMIDFGRRLGAALPPRALLLLSGNLGAGKTTLTKGIAEGLGVAAADEVSSPTFTLIHEYGDPVRLYHIDLYRLEEPRQFFTLGIEEILDRQAVTVIEWPERFLRLLPPDHLTLRLERAGDARTITITGSDVVPVPAILSTASQPMDAHPHSGESNQPGEAKETYALVAYLPEPIADYLNALRIRLDPGSEPHAHVTLLPPRQLSGTPEQAKHQLREYTATLESFTLDLADVEVFRETNVVFLAIGAGDHKLYRIHAALNSGALCFAEPFHYHPHITLVQFQPADQVAAKAGETRLGWQAYQGPRQFVVNRLTFVKHIGGNRWLDLDWYDLK
ncbi:MAG: tRNA (adenosine(37)-N6)-threonylcarbamoyltransferase complex ATPase subunit type 1 TsaE [Acidobacteria bacterium]|nr:tRNA (adenosine(37)-N6)-threonylcarbamoyltransferase complex ATPase subunit type 1 TsaE [Acidobacteriota bacterium]